MVSSRLMKKSPTTAIILILLLLTVSGCASLGQQRTAPESLEVRVDRYMKAHIDRQWDVVYSLYEPSFRQKTSMMQFISRQRQISWETYRIATITLSEDQRSADVQVRTDVAMMSFTFKDAPSEQRWIKIGSDWFFEPPEQVNPFAPTPAKKKKTPTP